MKPFQGVKETDIIRTVLRTTKTKETITMLPFKKKVDQSKKHVYRIEFTGVTIDGKTVTTNLDRLQEIFVEAEDEISAQKEFAAHINLPYKYIHSVKRIQFLQAFNK